jgi:hypothetical protein
VVQLPPGNIVTDVAIDQDSGDTLVMAGPVGPATAELLRVDRRTLALSTIAAGLGGAWTVEFEPRTGSFLVAGDMAAPIQRVTRAGVVSPLLPPLLCGGLKVDDQTGNLLADGVVAAGPIIAVLSPSGSVIRTYALPLMIGVTGIDIVGSRKLSGSGNFAAGSTYNLSFSFPPSFRNANYLAAASFAQRPGIPLPAGRMVNLAIDPLFLASWGGIPGVTTGFSGLLDSSARATGTIALPSRFPPGLRVFVAAVAWNPSNPNLLDSTNTLGLSSN